MLRARPHPHRYEEPRGGPRTSTEATSGVSTLRGTPRRRSPVHCHRLPVALAEPGAQTNQSALEFHRTFCGWLRFALCRKLCDALRCNSSPVCLCRGALVPHLAGAARWRVGRHYCCGARLACCCSSRICLCTNVQAMVCQMTVGPCGNEPVGSPTTYKRGDSVNIVMMKNADHWFQSV